MKHRLAFGFGTMFLLSTSLFAQSAGELYQQGLVQENGVGNLQNAIQLYQRAAKASAGDRALAAVALLAAARCYEKLGQEESVKLYEEIEKSYPDQREQAAQAWERLATLRNQPHGKTHEHPTTSELTDMSKYLADLEKQHAFLTSTYSPQHPQRQALVMQIADVSRGLQMLAQGQGLVPVGPGMFASKRTDPDQPIKFTGTVSDVQWINPHVLLITVEVQESNGERHSYRIKGPNPKALFGPGSAGYKTDIVKVGDIVTVEGLSHREEPFTIGFALLTLPDGSKFFAGGSNFP